MWKERRISKLEKTGTGLAKLMEEQLSCASIIHDGGCTCTKKNPVTFNYCCQWTGMWTPEIPWFLSPARNRANTMSEWPRTIHHAQYCVWPKYPTITSSHSRVLVPTTLPLLCRTIPMATVWHRGSPVLRLLLQQFCFCCTQQANSNTTFKALLCSGDSGLNQHTPNSDVRLE